MSQRNERLDDALSRIDERFVGEALEYYEEKSAAKKKVRQKYKRLVVLASAACLALLLLAIPAWLITREEYVYYPSDVRGEHNEGNISTVPEHDGSIGLVYKINEDGKSASFAGFGSCTDKRVVVASYYGDLPVTEAALGESANAGNRFVKELILPDTLKVFNESVITACINLERIYFGSGLEQIVPYRIQSGKLTTLEVSPENETLASVGNCIIERATKTLVRGCRSSIIPSDGSVESIGNRAFLSVLGLYHIEIPDSVTHIGSSAFAFSAQLQEITLPQGLMSLGTGVFLFCDQLKCVDLNGYSVLPREVFAECRRLAEVKGSENLTEIGEQAIKRCTNLNLTLSPALKKLNKYAFADFPTNITFTGTMAEWNAIEKHSLWAAYSNKAYKMEFVYCSDGKVAVRAVIMTKN